MCQFVLQYAAMNNPLSKEELGKKIKDLRAQKGVSQSTLGEAMGGRSHAAISDIENGKTELNASELPAIANFFNVDLSYFLQMESRNPSYTPFYQSRDSKNMTGEQKKEVDKSGQAFIEHLRDLQKEESQ